MVQPLTSEWSLEQVLFKRLIFDFNEEHFLLAFLLILLLVSDSELEGFPVARALYSYWKEILKLLFGLELMAAKFLLSAEAGLECFSFLVIIHKQFLLNAVCYEDVKGR